MNNYKVENGKMPEEFHLKHLINEVQRVVEIKCNQCDAQESIGQANPTLFKATTFEDRAAKEFYKDGWRYCTLPDWEVEGVFCADCVRDYGGTEDDSLQQPREKTPDE